MSAFSQRSQRFYEVKQYGRIKILKKFNKVKVRDLQEG